MSTNEPLRIVRLEATNVKRLKAVSIYPQGSLITIGGNNGNGKTSVLDSIAMALGGLAQAPAVPIRRGASKASIVLDLGDLVVRRTFSGKGGSSLVVENKEGVEQKSPQGILDALVGRLTFDPLAFSRMDSKKQVETLRVVTGLDFEDLDMARRRVYEDRTRANAELKTLETQLSGMPRHDGVPAALVERMARVSPVLQGFDDLSPKRAEVVAVIRANEGKRAAAKEAARNAAVVIQDHADAVEEVSRLKRALTTALGVEANLLRFMESAKADRDQLALEVSALVDPSMSEIDVEQRRREQANAAALEAERVAAAAAEQERQAVNAKVEANKRRFGVVALIQGAVGRVADLTEEIERIDREKAEALAAAKFPVPGLGFGDGGVLLNDLPFEQASEAEKLRVSVAMGLSLNPKLRVMLIRDGSLLDENSLALLAGLAEEHKAQVWMEVVGKGGRCQVVIEDGRVEGAEAEAAEAGANA